MRQIDHCRPGLRIRILIGERLEVSRLDLDYFIVRALAAKSHREFELANVELIGTLADHWPSRQDVIERSEAECSSAVVVDREVLGMPIGRSKHPEYQLRQHEEALI